MLLLHIELSGQNLHQDGKPKCPRQGNTRKSQWQLGEERQALQKSNRGMPASPPSRQRSSASPLGPRGHRHGSGRHPHDLRWQAPDQAGAALFGGKRRIQRRRQTDEEVQPPSGDQTTDCPLTSQRDRPTVSGLDQKIPPLLWCTPTTSSAPRNCESRTRPGRPMASCHHAKNVRQKAGSTKASLLGWGHCSASASRQSCPQHSHWRVSTSRTQPGAARSAGIRHKRVKSQAVFQSSAPSANANVTATITNPTTQLVA